MKKQEIDAIVKIMIVFLATLLVFSMVNGALTIYMMIGALSVTYLFVHYWEKKYTKNKKVK